MRSARIAAAVMAATAIAFTATPATTSEAAPAEFRWRGMICHFEKRPVFPFGPFNYKRAMVCHRAHWRP